MKALLLLAAIIIYPWYLIGSIEPAPQPLLLISGFDSEDNRVFYGVLNEHGFFVLGEPMEITWQEVTIEGRDLAGEIQDDNTIICWTIPEYIEFNCGVREGDTLKFFNTDGTYSYGFIDDQKKIEDHTKGGWNNLDGLAYYDNYTAL